MYQQQNKHRLPISKNWSSLKKDIVEQRRKENLDYFRNLPCVKKSKPKLKIHQLRIVEYLLEHISLLVIHRTGFGTLSACITTSQCLLNTRKIDRIIVVSGSPLSLKENFKKEMTSYGLKGGNYRFYTYTKFAKEYGNTITNEDLSNTFLIIDEAHNLTTNGKGTKKILLAAKSAKKILLLTAATPVINFPGDIVNLMKMLDLNAIL
jgi:hypothetical protein